MGFKVIVVGGGPVGLVAAHALHLAGIDFVLLERREHVVDPSGASVVLSPPSMRILSQFGIQQEIEDAGAELEHVKSFTRQGYKFKDSTQVRLLKECLGAAQVIYHRPELVQIMFDGLPSEAKDKILTKKKVTRIEQDEESATVHCADSTSFTGSLVIGADGVHSRTREQLRQAMMQDGQQDECDDEQPYESEYRMLWCTFPRPASLHPGLGGETQDTGRTLAVMVGKASTMIICYEKLEKKTRERVDYTEKDMAQLAERFANYPVSETLLFKDVYNSQEAGMFNLHEGMVKNLFKGRVVLVGDSAHRFTPNAGLGLNNGIQDVVVVCNGIHAAIQDAKDGNPNRATLEETFAAYRDERHAFVTKDLRGSALLTRLQAWASNFMYVLARFLLVPDWFQRLTIRYVAVPSMRLAPVLRYPSAIKAEPYVGTIPWAHAIQPMIEKKA
ncbi:hypothetical protein F5Y18DRAFT_440175 [Xylariaceae sp. FL1019]|nr:hypothetical protein F5Y18DRAFT_440175 [Xylariaceae sp. FL1019]